MVSCVLNKVLTDPNSYVYSYNVSSDLKQLYNGNWISATYNGSTNIPTSNSNSSASNSASDSRKYAILNSILSFLPILFIF